MDGLVTDLVERYRKDICETKEGREALDALHVSSPEVVEHFSLGYCTGEAIKSVSEEQYKLLVGLGLAFKRRERFHGCVVFPVTNIEGEMVDLCGLRAWPSGRRTVLWQEPTRGIIGARALKVHADVVLTENPFLALGVREHGYPNVIAFRKPEEVKQQLSLFEKLCLQRVHLVARKGRPAITKALAGIGVEVVTVKLPAKGIVVPKEALSMVGGTLPMGMAAQDVVKLVSRTDTRLSFSAGDVTYKVDATAASGLGLRVQVRAESKDAIFLDRLDLSSSQARRKYARACSSRLGVAAMAVQSHLAGVASTLDEMAEEEAKRESPAPKVLSSKEASDAMKVLGQGDVLAHLSGAVEKLFMLAGEEENKRLAILVAFSRLLDQPLGAIARGGASCGKSMLIQVVSGTLPAGEVLYLSRMTPQALFYLPKESLQHKLLVCDEYAGLQEAEYAIREVMSNQSLTVAITIREGGRLPVTRTIEIPATLSVLVSTTNPVNIENLSRFIEIRMDSSPHQTKRVMKAIAEGHERKAEVAKRTDAIERVRNLSRMLKPCSVEVPFARKLVYGSPSVLARRQFTQVVGLVSAHAALHQHQRECVEAEGKLIVSATKADYEAVHPLLGHVVEHFEEEISPAAMELLQMIGKRKASTFTCRDAMSWLGWSYSRAHRTLAELEGIDLLIPDSTTNGVLRTYEATPYFLLERGISRIPPPSAL